MSPAANRYEYDAEKRAALELWADALAGIIAGRPSPGGPICQSTWVVAPGMIGNFSFGSNSAENSALTTTVATSGVYEFKP